MQFLRAVVRTLAAVLILVGTTLLIVILSWIPIYHRGLRLSAWFFSWGTRMILPVLGLHFRCATPEKFIQHRGLIFPNHLSNMDILIMAYLMPVRFVAKQEVRDWPFIGRIATATGTMYVNRSDKTSRLNARRELARRVAADPYPPVVVFPEGTRNPDSGLLPFRYGAFEIAVQENIPYLLCAIVYERPDLVTWQSRSEGVWGAVMRMVCAETSVVELVPLAVIEPSPDDDHQQLADEAREIISNTLHQSYLGMVT